MFDAAETLSKIKVPTGEALAIFDEWGGAGVLATDTLIEQGGRLAELGPETMVRLDKVLPPTWSHGNPIDIIGDAPSERYERSLGALFEDASIDAVLVLNCPTAVSSSTRAADAVIRAVGKRRKPIVLTNWLGGQAAEAARQRFDEHGIPTYETPSDAVCAFMHLVEFKRNQIVLAATPPSIPEMFEPNVERARKLLTEAASEGREWLI